MEVKYPLFFIISGLFIIFYLLRFFQFKKTAEFYVPKQLWRGGIFGIRHINLLIGLAGACLVGFSLTQPRSPLGFAKNEIKVNDIFMVVDVSRSMLAEDFAPNRLESAKEKIREFVKLRPTDRIGIVMFSEKAFTLLPLSTDLKLIEQIIDEIKVGFLGMGTNIGDALGLAVGRAAQSLAKSKVIILLTDGVSNVGNMTPEQSAEEAKKQGVKVYTIGIGQKANGALLKSGRGRGRYQRIPGGSVDLETLDMIAEKTGGKSYYASDEGALSQVLSEIQELEKTEIETSAKIIYKELYWRYLALGLFLLLLSEFISMIFLREVL